MNINRIMFGRINIGTKRHSLGQATLGTLLVRARETISAARVDSKEILITMELSTVALPDSTAFSRESVIEQSLASQFASHDEESPFEGITIGRVAEVMSSPEYIAYAGVCEPDKRLGVEDSHIQLLRTQYQQFAPDCFDHFPKWVDS